jgi:hypothetical protein
VARAQLRNGVIGAAGGKRKGSGRKTEDFKTQLARLNAKDDILGQVRMMAKGEIEVSDKVRLSASLWLLEMEHGKPAQMVGINSESNRIIVEFKS